MRLWNFEEAMHQTKGRRRSSSSSKSNGKGNGAVEMIEYGRSLRWKLQSKDELVDEVVLGRGCANHQEFFKAFWRRKLKGKPDN